MASIYDKITTVKELLENFRMHGRSTKMEDVVRIQDIVGRTPIDELAEIANSDGRTQNDFYSMLFDIWHWGDAIRFYNEHTGKVGPVIRELEDKVRKCEKQKDADNARLADDNKRLYAVLTEKTKEADDAGAENDRLRIMLDDKDLEIMKLKAKLYDLMMEGKA